MSSRQVEVPGGRLSVRDEGAGPPIVLLHAGVADLRAWDDVVPPLIAAGYRAVRYDARGHGPSPTDDVAFSQRADLLAVLDALGIGRAALVGNSRGGMIALDTAIEAPGSGRRRRRGRAPGSAASTARRRRPSRSCSSAIGPWTRRSRSTRPP